jgi:hypothetical protein
MTCPKLKTVFCLAVCLAVLISPCLFEISSDGKAYAGGSSNGSKKKDSHYTSASKAGPEEFGYTIGNPENSTAPAPVPEPATWLLVGAGAAGMAVFKKKFRKK